MVTLNAINPAISSGNIVLPAKHTVAVAKRGGKSSVVGAISRCAARSTLADLHYTIQISFGKNDAHLGSVSPLIRRINHENNSPSPQNSI